MDLTCNIILNTFSALVLVIIAVYSFDKNGSANFNKIYNSMLVFTLVLLVLDSLGRFDGYPGTAWQIINRSANFLLFLICPILPSLWLIFVYDNIFKSKKRNRQLQFYLFTINAVNGVLLLYSLNYDWYYYIDANNIYHRGSLYILSTVFTAGQLAVSLLLVFVNKKRIEKKHYGPFIFFVVPPFLGAIIQTVIYGISIVLNGVVLSLLIVYLYIQNQNMYIDYLTGVYNRKMLEVHLGKKIDASTDTKTFSAIMIDLNNFKYINDTFGHLMGDNALIIAANLLKCCIKNNDMIARYGGDEFVIVLDTSDPDVLQSMVDKIYNCIEKYNETSDCPFKIGLSMGYAVYDSNQHMNAEQFQKDIDRLMYQNKFVTK